MQGSATCSTCLSTVLHSMMACTAAAAAASLHGIGKLYAVGALRVPPAGVRSLELHLLLFVIVVRRGRWHSSDVAIKIMSCTRAELARVLREAEVMMQVWLKTTW
jgi:hypothetical protein